MDMQSNEFDNVIQKMICVRQTGAEEKPVTSEKQNISDIRNNDGQFDNAELNVREKVFDPNKPESSPDTDTIELDGVDNIKNKASGKEQQIENIERGTKENTSYISKINSLSAVTSKLELEIKEKLNNKEQQDEEVKESCEKELTEEETDELMKASMREVRTNVEFIKIESNREKSKDKDYNAKLKNAVLRIYRCHSALKKASHIVYMRYKTEYYKELASSGAVPILCEIVLYILTTGYKFEPGNLIYKFYSKFDLLSTVTSILMNFSDGDPEDTCLIADYPNLLVVIGQKLTEFHEKGLSRGNYREWEWDAVILKNILSIIHNLGMADGNEQKLHSRNFVQILKPYLESSNDMVRLISLSTLGEIVNEEDSKILQANPDILKCLMYTLKKATENEIRRECGWSVKELCRAIQRIARNDSNKKALVEHESVELLVTIAAGTCSDVEEQREAVGALRTLSFDKSNQQFFMSNTDLGVIETFITQQNSPDKEIRKACEGALWNMREVLSKNERYKDSVKHIVSKVQVRNGNQDHVMLSYQWGNQKTIIRINELLKSNGFKVWMDVEDMAGSTLHAMAKAVENASIVLVCYSQKYKDSDNCRAEAEYAFQLKKKIIPLRMERNYRADGWLGFIIGTKLYHDFSGKYTFESRIEKLLKEAHSMLKGDQAIPDHTDLTLQKVTASVGHEPLIVPQKQTTKTMAPSPSETEVVRNWSDTQVKQWLDKHNLDRNKFNNLKGIEIAFLQILRHESPDFFYRSLTDMLKINDLFTMSKFVFALTDIKSIQESQK